MLTVMPDYGHPLRFGSFITPVNSPPRKAVDLARASEELGYDLVTFQDHPYQAGFHDTWTLLTSVAAETERIHLSGNVLNGALRQPVILARSSASLDLLSGGRFELGLGAGGFWDAIASIGGEKLTPGQGVDALDESIQIIRGIWDASERSALRVPGTYHHVDGAKRGPAPAHDIPIWLGALKPRMLRLLGRAADGWLPSLPYLQPGDLARGNAAIDAAATGAGRDPREITRLLNVTAQTGADELARLALEDGISTFIVMGDDPRILEYFAREVAPRVRDEVGAARERAGAPSGARMRSAAVLAKRAPGIDYDALTGRLADIAVEPGDAVYARVATGYMRGGHPGLVLRARDAADVQEAVAFAARHRDLPLGIRSAGHGISGRSLNDGGLVIDVSQLNTVEVTDAERGLVRVGPGAKWVEVARALEPYGLAITSGDYGGVGVGGLATAGGIGFLAREHGLTIDHLRGAEVVLADGALVHASATENADLFWALRGAGANFGVVTSFEFEAARVGEVAFFQLVYDAGDTADFIERFGAAVEASDRSVTAEFILGAPQRGQTYAQVIGMVDSDDPDTVIARLQPLAAVAPLVQQQVSLMTYADAIGSFYQDGDQGGRGEPIARSGLIDHLSGDFAAEAAAFLTAGASPFFAVRAAGGAVSDIAPDATAYAWRSANFSVTAIGSAATRLDAAWARLEPYFEGMYLSFETRTGPEIVAQAFPPATLARLRELKRRYDPSGLFRDNFFIEPA